ncbi:MAG: MarC family protein [archaeon]
MNAIDLPLIIQIFVLLNPMASFPFLVSAYEHKLNVRNIAVKAVLVALIVALTILFIGPYLFNIFGIGIDSFRIAGGVVLLLLGVEMVRPKKAKAVDKEKVKVNSIITLIATPMLTGPATISFITLKSYDIGKMTMLTNLLLAFFLLGIVFFLFSVFITKINMKIIDIASRVMGLFLTAVAIEMMAKGIEGIIRAYVGA